MDFANISLRAAAEAGTAVHLSLNDRTLYVQADKTIGHSVTDRPCRVHVRGLAANGVLDITKEIERQEMVHGARVSRAKDKELPSLAERHQEAMAELIDRLLFAAVDRFENIIFAGKVAEPDRETIQALCGRNTAFFGQVYEAVLEQKRFLTDAANG